MSKKAKLIERFLSKPKDFRWDELVTLMSRFGFVLHESCGGSSHKKFVSRRNEAQMIFTPRPHPTGMLKGYQLDEIQKKLKEWEILK